MKTRIALLAAAAFSLAGIANAQEAAPNVPDQLNVTINTQQAADPVSKYVFGSFIEHIGGTIYRSVWAELIDDRKFWSPITSKEEALPPGQNAAQRQRMMLRKWRPVGPDEVVTMDKEQPFVGDQSPSIKLDASTPHGIRQAGFSVVKSKAYTGRIWLKGSPGAKVTVSLVWGEGAEKQAVTIPALTAEYKKFPLSFTSKADTGSAAIEITGTGSGSFHVGAVSLMPADNVQGFRPDTIALLRAMHSGMWRLPGGNFLSDWMWYDAIGDIDKRPPMFDHAWNAMQVNDVGMDEFMTLCKLIDVDPYVTVNAGFGDSHSAAEEVEYLNGSVNTRLGALRAKNGHPEPYHIKYWNIGNEPWGASFQMGYTPLNYWVFKNNEFYKAMLKADPTITIIGSGKMLEPMMLRGEERRKYVDNLTGAYGNEIDWTGGMMMHSFGTFQGMAQHWYEGPGRHFDIQKAKALPADAQTGGTAVAVAPTNSAMVMYEPTTLEYARYAGDIIRRHAEEWQGYLDRFPAAKDKKIFLSIDEYAYGGLGGAGRGGPNLKTALAYGMLLNEWMRHTDYVTMGARTMGTSALDITPTGSTYNTVGLTYKLYGEQFPGAIPVALNGNSPQPATNPNYADEPKVRSGSPTYPLDMFAALSADKKSLILSVVNATDKEQKVNLSVTGTSLAGPGKAWTLCGTSLDAANRVGEQQQVQVKETSLPDAPSSLTAAPYTVSIYRFPVGAK